MEHGASTCLCSEDVQGREMEGPLLTLKVAWQAWALMRDGDVVL